MGKTRFSIIIPTYNSSNRVLETIESVFNQTYKDYEIIIQDGKSEDNTLELLNVFKNDSRVYIVSEKDKSVYDAMNKAVASATGDYCIFLGAGDRLHNKNVLTKIDENLSNHEYDILCGYVITNDNGKLGEIRVKPDWMYTVRFIPICHQSVFAKRSLLIQRPFDIKYRVGADQDWLMYMKKTRKRFGYIDFPVSIYMKDGLSSSELGNHIFVEEKREIQKKYYPLRFKFITWHKKRKANKT